MKIYLDSEFRCYVEENSNTTMTIETNLFDGKCSGYIQGYRFVPAGSRWIRDDGSVFEGRMVAPWKDWDELDAVQREYEKQTIQELQETVAELDAALLDTTYNNIVGGI